MSVWSQSALCDGTAEARNEHAAALIEDGGPKSLISGSYLIELLDVGCKGN